MKSKKSIDVQKVLSCPPECKIVPALKKMSERYSTITKKIKSSREDEKSYGTQQESCTMIQRK